MKKKVLCILVFLFTFFVIHLSAQQNTWTWMNGDALPNQPGVYGTLGIPSPWNKPHARYEACQWTDLQGNFWLYGGGLSWTKYSDLWRYEPASNNWTWMHGSQVSNQPAVYGTKGTADPANTPGGNGYGSVTWTDLNGNLWMYGVHDGINGFNLLWEYNIITNEWSWIHGDTIAWTMPTYGIQGISSPANTPGARSETACSWTDNNGNLWLFGGSVFGVGNCTNDLWKYNISANEWTWMSGDNVANVTGVYGTRGVSNPANKPGSRWCYTSWKDSTGNLWLFGGVDASNAVALDYFNDLWKYDVTLNEWTWMSGSNQVNQPGFYGIKCTSSTLTSPGGRLETKACWKDDCNNFWLFGGEDLNNKYHNDLWRYNLTTDRWYWVSGSSGVNQQSIYGTQQVPSPANIPSSRMGSVSWKNNNGLWLFGGMDFTNGEWNDLWKFSVEDTTCGFCAAQPVALFMAPNTICPGTCIDFINQSQGALSISWSFPGGIPSVSTDVNPNICYNVPGSYDVTLIATNALSSDTLALNNYMTVNPFPPPQGILQNGDTLFSNAGAVSYQWYHNGVLIPGATDYYYVAPESGNFQVIATDNNGCEVEAVINDVIASSSQLAVRNGQLAIYPNPVSEILEIRNLNQEKEIIITVYSILGTAVSLPTAHCQLPTCSIDVSSLASGAYWIEITEDKHMQRIKFVKK